MVAFRKNLKAKDADPWIPLALREERAAWRDSLTLLQATGAEKARPKMLDWLYELVDVGVLEKSTVVPLDLYGLCAARGEARVLLWRHERLPLPLRYLVEKDLLHALRRALELAEGAAGALERCVRIFCRLMLAPGDRQPDRGDVTQLLKSLAPTRNYWSHLEAPFKKFLVELPQDVGTAEDGGIEYGAQTLREWAATLRRAGTDALRRTIGASEPTARALKAAVRAEQEWYREARSLLGEYLYEEEVMSGTTNCT
jgi:hypothetical protein